MLTGAVLAGGRSLRYGTNKALEVFRGKRLIDRGVEALRPFCAPVLVVVNDLSGYYDVQATLVQDIVVQQGPLGGIYTALLFSPHEWVFVKATDMPLLVPGLVDLMLNFIEGFDVVVPRVGDWYEPLFALYHRRCIPAIAEMLEGTDRKVATLYKKVRVKSISEKKWRSTDSEGLSFRNVNTPADWEHITDGTE